MEPGTLVKPANDGSPNNHFHLSMGLMQKRCGLERALPTSHNN